MQIQRLTIVAERIEDFGTRHSLTMMVRKELHGNGVIFCAHFEGVKVQKDQGFVDLCCYGHTEAGAIQSYARGISNRVILVGGKREIAVGVLGYQQPVERVRAKAWRW